MKRILTAIMLIALFGGSLTGSDAYAGGLSFFLSGKKLMATARQSQGRSKEIAIRNGSVYKPASFWAHAAIVSDVPLTKALLLVNGRKIANIKPRCDLYIGGRETCPYYEPFYDSPPAPAHLLLSFA